MSAALLTKTLDEELTELAAGTTDECLVCGEAVVRADAAIECSQCGARLEDGADLQVQLRLQAG